jgi:Sec-independent protein translocase protein TatA
MPLTTVTQNPSQSAAIVLAFAAGVAVGANWPKIRKSLAPLMAVAGDRFGDVYSAVAQALGEQKEAMEDARAERRHRSRSKSAQAPEQELLASLAAALLQGKKRPAAKSARKRTAARPRKTTVPPVHAASDGNS